MDGEIGGIAVWSLETGVETKDPVRPVLDPKLVGKSPELEEAIAVADVSEATGPVGMDDTTEGLVGRFESEMVGVDDPGADCKVSVTDDETREDGGNEESGVPEPDEDVALGSTTVLVDALFNALVD